MAKKKIIHINITADTSRLLNDFPQLSKDQNNPTYINPTYLYMIVSDNSAINGQGTGDLSIVARVGDILRFYATSEYNNFNQPVILYNLSKTRGDNVLKTPTFTLRQFPRHKSIDPTDYNPLTSSIDTHDFWFAENQVIQTGAETFLLNFALYDSDCNLCGYFSWDPTIIVK